MHHFFKELTQKEIKTFEKLNTPQKIQDFLEKIPFNFEEQSSTIMSPRSSLEEGKVHCFEGALLAAAILWYHGVPPILLDLKTNRHDDDHVLALFKLNGRWGAISKTNHSVLRYRDPVYKNARELAMSYFHEYFLDDGEKTLRSFAVFDLRKIKKNWVIDEMPLKYIDRELESISHEVIVSEQDLSLLRRADVIERKVGRFAVWPNGKRSRY